MSNVETFWKTFVIGAGVGAGILAAVFIFLFVAAFLGGILKVFTAPYEKKKQEDEINERVEIFQKALTEFRESDAYKKIKEEIERSKDKDDE